MKGDIRRKTAIVIQKDGSFLVGFSLFLRWAASPWDAWRTRDKEAAKRVAAVVGGEMMLFNPVAGQIRKMKGVTQ